MALILETDTISSTNITTRAQIASYTAAADIAVAVQVLLKTLNGAATTLTLDLTITRTVGSSIEFDGLRFSDAKRAAADTDYFAQFQAVALKNGDVLKVYATSTNVADTAATGEVVFSDPNGASMALTSSERDSIAAALLDLAAGVETGLTLRQALRLIAASTAGKLSGGGTVTEVIRNAVADSKDRITATVDSSGNRSAITYDLT